MLVSRDRPYRVGHPDPVNHMFSAGRADKDLPVKRNALTQIILPDEQSTPMNSLDVNARGLVPFTDEPFERVLCRIARVPSPKVKPKKP